ncbi:MAG: hypothetical protein AUH68_01270 [Gemmatimonadetes bacterium 13_1_40CM_4_69_5]|nr:MAG: hypothetical protein AUH68_01270 [Gemmatimonadetes bacterium 13_1_40CM_4_69_5]
MRPQQVGELAQHALHLALLGRFEIAQLVAQLDDLGRLDEHRRPARRGVVDDAADARARGGAHGDDVAVVADGHGGVGDGVLRVEAVQQRFEPCDETLARLAHGLASPGEVARRAVEDFAVRRDRRREPRVHLLGRWVDPQRGGARGVLRQTPQLGRRVSRRDQRRRHQRQGRPVEGAAGDGEEVEGGSDVGNGFSADGVVGDEEALELGDLREGGADGVRVAAGAPRSDPRGAQGADGERRDPLQRGGKLQRLQDGGRDPAHLAHTVAANSSRAI